MTNILNLLVGIVTAVEVVDVAVDVFVVLTI
jgi:hypothetical protein